MKLPDNLEGLIMAQNQHDSVAFAAYFTEKAIVSDEGSTYAGRGEIRRWIQQATKKYQMQLKPIDVNQTGTSIRLTVEVTGTFPGSPIVMQYQLEQVGVLFRSLQIKG